MLSMIEEKRITQPDHLRWIVNDIKSYKVNENFLLLHASFLLSIYNENINSNIHDIFNRKYFSHGSFPVLTPFKERKRLKQDGFRNNYLP